MTAQRKWTVASLVAFSIAVLGTVNLGEQCRAAEDAPPKVGDAAKDFELSTPGGDKVKLSTLNKEGPVVLLVLRGWPGYQCPICSRQVGEFIGNAKKFKELGANIVMVYPGPGEGLKEHANEFVKGKTLPDNFSFVVDPDYDFTQAYNLRWDASRETAYPSTFVVGADGKIGFAKISMTHGGRTSADEVLTALGTK